MSEEEEEAETDTLVDEILQQGDTAVIYPEAPEDEQSPAETGGADENGNIYTTTRNCSFQQLCCEYSFWILIFLIMLESKAFVF